MIWKLLTPSLSSFNQIITWSANISRDWQISFESRVKVVWQWRSIFMHKTMEYNKTKWSIARSCDILAGSLKMTAYCHCQRTRKNDSLLTNRRSRIENLEIEMYLLSIKARQRGIEQGTFGSPFKNVWKILSLQCSRNTFEPTMKQHWNTSWNILEATIVASLALYAIGGRA